MVCQDWTEIAKLIAKMIEICCFSQNLILWFWWLSSKHATKDLLISIILSPNITFLISKTLWSKTYQDSFDHCVENNKYVILSYISDTVQLQIVINIFTKKCKNKIYPEKFFIFHVWTIQNLVVGSPFAVSINHIQLRKSVIIKCRGWWGRLSAPGLRCHDMSCPITWQHMTHHLSCPVTIT